ncbi:MAG TPA: hypothetical protein VFZ52_03080 [Chryseolinea sp.]
MKFATILFAWTIVSCPISACDDDEAKTKTVAFELEFSSFLKGANPEATCGAPPTVLVIQEGNGTSTLLESFSFYAEFCNNLETGEYGPAKVCIFKASNGDELHCNAQGQVVPTTNPNYDLEFKDPFTITGGTGRFKGATGSGTTSSFVKLADKRTDHVWTGTITLVK